MSVSAPRERAFLYVDGQVVNIPGKIAVIGAGLVGSGWAIVFARAGRDVAIYDSVPSATERALATIAVRLDDLVQAGPLADAASVRARIRPASTLTEALTDAVYAQESVFERADTNGAVLTEIDRVVGHDTIIGSSSSGIPTSVYSDHMACRARCFAVHPVNPPYLTSVVELVPVYWTDPEAVRRTRALMETWQLVEGGMASLEDVDRTVADGLGLRWSFMGLAVRDGRTQRPRHRRRLCRPARPDLSPYRRLGHRTPRLGRRAGLPIDALVGRGAWRDRRLMALTRHKRDMAAGEEAAAADTTGS
jgi:hypothetical protein